MGAMVRLSDHLCHLHDLLIESDIDGPTVLRRIQRVLVAEHHPIEVSYEH